MAEHHEPRAFNIPIDLGPPHPVLADPILNASRAQLQDLDFLPSMLRSRGDNGSPIMDMVDMSLTPQNIHALTLINPSYMYDISSYDFNEPQILALSMNPISMTDSGKPNSPSLGSGQNPNNPNCFPGFPAMVENYRPPDLHPSGSHIMPPDPAVEITLLAPLQHQIRIHKQQRGTDDKMNRAQNNWRGESKSPQNRRHQKKDEEIPLHLVEVVGVSKHQCEYLGCNKAFRRKEHLKRHIQA